MKEVHSKKPRQPLCRQKQKLIAQIQMQPRIETLPQRKLIGKRLPTTFTNNQTSAFGSGLCRRESTLKILLVVNYFHCTFIRHSTLPFLTLTQHLKAGRASRKIARYH